MVTSVKKTSKKKVTKKATKVNSLGKTNLVSMTLGQANTIASFYTKQGKNVPAFLVKKLNA